MKKKKKIRIKEPDPYMTQIRSHIVCHFCLEQLPAGMSPSEYHSIEVGINFHDQIEVWCKRHRIRLCALALVDPPQHVCKGCGDPMCGKPVEPLFKPGEGTPTKGIDAAMKADPTLGEFILTCLDRHILGDGGDISENDKVSNLRSILKGKGRIASSYNKEGVPGGKICVTTEGDPPNTIIFFPTEH